MFYVETHYQFLQALSLVLKWRESQSFDFGEEIYIVDATNNKVLFSKRQMLYDVLGVKVIDVKVCSFYVSAMLSFFITYKFRKFSGCSFFMFNNRSPIVNKLSSIFSVSGNVIQVEEGLSLYRKPVARSVMENIASFLKRTFVTFFTFSRFSDFIGDTVYSDTVFLRYDSLVRESKHLLPKKVLRLPSLQKLSSVSWILNKLYDADRFVGSNFNSQCVLYFGQPLSELGILGRQVEVDAIKRVEEVVLSLGLSFIVKTHPVESISKYSSLNCEMISGDIPAEVMCLNFQNVKGVISFYSTAALNVSDLLGVPSYFLYECCGLNINFPILKDAKLIRSFDHDELSSLFLSD